MNIQYKKGVLELCILSVLYHRDCYGYDVSEYISRYIDISEGTVYPILRKLKAEGLVTTYLTESSSGPPRRYYSLTELGRTEYIKAKEDWTAFTSSVGHILEGEEKQ